MTRESALEQLNDPNSDVRLRAARELAALALEVDEPALRRRRRVESVPWVRAAIEGALASISSSPAAGSEEPISDEGGEEVDVASECLEGVRLTTDRLVHELRSIVGTLRYWAEREHPSYGGSGTERQIERLRRCLEAIDYVGKVARSPTVEQFDLSQLIADEVSAVAGLNDVTTLIGPQPLISIGDRGVVGLVLSNALRNAAESGGDQPPAVHVNWGETEIEYWVAVFDRGSGLPQEPEALFDFGSTTKQGHVGAGLAIVGQAAVALKGTVTLSEEADGTTKFEFRWPRSTERSDAATSS